MRERLAWEANSDTLSAVPKFEKRHKIEPESLKSY